MDAEISVDEDRGTIDLTVTGSREEIESIMPFDLARAVKEGCRTRDGRPVRIICTDRGSDYPVIALVKEGAYEAVYCFTKSGRPTIDENLRRAHDHLVNLPEAHEVTVQLYKNGEQWCAKVILDPGFTNEYRCGMLPCLGMPEWGKPVTVRIEKDD